MNRYTVPPSTRDAAPSARSTVFGYWRSYWFGFYFADEGAPGD